eukprot:7999644-Prorocentrum_lima.AAC.1
MASIVFQDLIIDADELSQKQRETGSLNVPRPTWLIEGSALPVVTGEARDVPARKTHRANGSWGVPVH